MFSFQLGTRKCYIYVKQVMLRIPTKFVAVLTAGILVAAFIHTDYAMAAALTSVRSQPTSNIVTTIASYEILFTTGTTGKMKTVTMAFPAGYVVGSAILIERAGVRAGGLSASGTTLTYTISSPVSIAAGTPIRLELANINHPSIPGTYSITITTKDSLGRTIDGPTAGTSSVVQIGRSAIANGAVSISTTSVLGQTVQVQPGTTSEAGVECPLGSVVTGGGWTAGGIMEPEEEGTDVPMTNPTDWFAIVHNPTSTTQPFTVTAVCATIHP